jgi:hypothetical protein
VCNEFSLDLGNQIAMALIYHKTNWTPTPGIGLIEISKPFAM